jgi:hypothetical protein
MSVRSLRGGIFTTSIPDEEPEPGGALPQVDQQVPDLLPGLGRLRACCRCLVAGVLGRCRVFAEPPLPGLLALGRPGGTVSAAIRVLRLRRIFGGRPLAARRVFSCWRAYQAPVRRA